MVIREKTFIFLKSAEILLASFFWALLLSRGVEDVGPHSIQAYGSLMQLEYTRIYYRSRRPSHGQC